MSTEMNTLVIDRSLRAPARAPQRSAERTDAGRSPASGASRDVSCGGLLEIHLQERGHGGQPRQDVADLVDPLRLVGVPERPGQLADLLDEPPKRAVHASLRVSLEVGPPDRALELGQVHRFRPQCTGRRPAIPRRAPSGERPVTTGPGTRPGHSPGSPPEVFAEPAGAAETPGRRTEEGSAPTRRPGRAGNGPRRAGCPRRPGPDR